MEPILKSEIFFFISSIFVAILTVVLIFFGYYLIKAMKNFSEISEKLKNTVNSTEKELHDMSMHVRESPIFNFIFGKRKNKK
ncbi:MAG TPA: hypothetical protein VMR49_02570 [Candidatus Paceibacterota bacterium]|nr:hypothetical protein [Candidatus Paceibacterota bacterium]